MLAQYHRWVFENHMQESVTALRTWVIQEAEFQTIASETVHGFSGTDSTAKPVARYKNHFLEIQKVTRTLKSCFVGYAKDRMGYGTVQHLYNRAYLIAGMWQNKIIFAIVV